MDAKTTMTSSWRGTSDGLQLLNHWPERADSGELHAQRWLCVPEASPPNPRSQRGARLIPALITPVCLQLGSDETDELILAHVLDSLVSQAWVHRSCHGEPVFQLHLRSRHPAASCGILPARISHKLPRCPQKELEAFRRRKLVRLRQIRGRRHNLRSKSNIGQALTKNSACIRQRRCLHLPPSSRAVC